MKEENWALGGKLERAEAALGNLDQALEKAKSAMVGQIEALKLVDDLQGKIVGLKLVGDVERAREVKGEESVVEEVRGVDEVLSLSSGGSEFEEVEVEADIEEGLWGNLLSSLCARARFRLM